MLSAMSGPGAGRPEAGGDHGSGRQLRGQELQGTGTAAVRDGPTVGRGTGEKGGFPNQSSGPTAIQNQVVHGGLQWWGQTSAWLAGTAQVPAKNGFA